MANTFEQEGYPTVVITALGSIAKMMKVARLTPGIGIPHPCGDPSLGDGEGALRDELVTSAVSTLGSES